MKNAFFALLCLAAACSSATPERGDVPEIAASSPPRTSEPAAVEPLGGHSGDWQWRNPLPSANSLYGVAFHGAELGVAVGDKHVVRTTDGGAHWSEIAVAPLEHIEAVQFTSPTHLVAAGWNRPSVKNPGAAALVSDDGGATWSRVPLPLTDFYGMQDVQFDGERGVIVGDGHVLVSADAGLSWSEKSPKSYAGNLAGAYVRGKTIWAAGTEGIRLSGDFGETWSAPQSAPPIALYGIAMGEGGAGVAVGEKSQILRTSDGGKTWKLTYAAKTWRLLRRVRFLDASHVIAVGFFGALFVSADGGTSWSEIDAGNRVTYFFAAANAGEKVWVVGTRGTIYRSDDWGASWTDEQPGTGLGWWRAAFPDPLHGFLVGELGGILKTTDGGKSWQVSQARYQPYLANIPAAPLGNSLHGVHFLDQNEGWAVGDPVRPNPTTVTQDSVILHTVDGGASWQLVPSHTQTPLQNVSFVDAQHGWIAGDAGVFRTTDGASFTKLTVPQGRYTDVAALSANEAWVSGYNLLLHTVDGGASWSQVKPGKIGILWSLRFFDAKHAIASGVTMSIDAGFEVTDDGGASWTTVSVGPGGPAFSAALAPDLKNGVAALGGGRILRTSDGGHSWTSDTEPTFLGLWDARAVAGGFMVAGEFGSVLTGPPLASQPQ